MKHTPLQRKTPLRRRTPRRVSRETPAERYWKEWIHTRPCAGARSFTSHGHPDCLSRVQQAHFRDHTGLGLKESNFKSIPLCREMHEDYDQTKGWFAPMGNVGKKSWFAMRLIEERADFEREHGCTPEEWKAITFKLSKATIREWRKGLIKP